MYPATAWIQAARPQRHCPDVRQFLTLRSPLLKCWPSAGMQTATIQAANQFLTVQEHMPHSYLFTRARTAPLEHPPCTAAAAHAPTQAAQRHNPDPKPTKLPCSPRASARCFCLTPAVLQWPYVHCLQPLLKPSVRAQTLLVVSTRACSARLDTLHAGQPEKPRRQTH